MMRARWIIAFSVVCSLSAAARAERLELGVAMTPTWILDDHYEAFSADDRLAARFGLDLRTEVASVKGFHFVPFLGYRFAYDSGYVYNALDTALKSHDFALGLRVRKGIFSWMAPFAEVAGGVLYAAMDAELEDSSPGMYGSDLEPLVDYEDRAVTWSVAALLGVEFTMSRDHLEKRGITRFCFGGEIAGGYIWRGDLSFDPTLEGGDDNAIPGDTVGAWGAVDASGGMAQMAFNLYFF
jgi:hypothetical protein